MFDKFKRRSSESSPEDGADNDLNENPSENEEEKVKRRINRSTRQANQSKQTCRTRIDKLATPNRRCILALYQDHAQHFPRERVEKIKQLLQELYAMTPEETERYFQYLQNKYNQIEERKHLKQMLKKLVRKREKRRQTAKAYKMLETLLKRGMEYAFKNPVPPLVSVRLRYLADLILEQICDLRNMKIPNRDDPDQIGLFLIALADWLAIAVEYLYYNVQLKKNEELEKIEELENEKSKIKKEGTGTNLEEKKSVEDLIQKIDPDEEIGVLSNPMSLSAVEE